MNIQANHRKDNILLPLGIFILVWSLIFIGSGLVNAGFNYLIDDHEIVVTHELHLSFEDIIIKPFSYLFSNEPKSRFRPIYDILLRLCTQLYGLNPIIWYLSSLLVAITTSFVFYLVGRLQEFSQLEAIGFTGLIILGQQVSTYTRFGTPETTATLFVALSLLFASLNSDRYIRKNIFNCLFILFALLAALNKEACILILPGLVYFKIWHLARSTNISLRESFAINRFSTIFILSCFVFCLVYIKLAGVSGPGYAGVDGDTLSISRLFDSLLSNAAIFGSAIIANIGYYLTTENRDRIQIDRFYVLASLLIIPQLIIYNKTGMNWHYILPAAIGVSLLAFYPISRIEKKSSKPYRIVIYLVIIILTLQLIFTGAYFVDISKRTTPIQVMVSDISHCVGQSNYLAIVGNPDLDFEALTAIYEIRNSVIHNDRMLLETYGSYNSDLTITIDELKADEKKWHSINSQSSRSLKNTYNNMTIDRQNSSAIKGIVLTHASKVEKSMVALNLDWFQVDRLTKKIYPKLDISVYCKK